MTWIRRARFVLLSFTIAFPLVLMGWSEADAIPAFARKYDMDCSHCHSMAPKLNRVGNRFHDNFTLKGLENELDPEVRDRVRSEDPEDIHPAYWPVSIRMAGGYQYDKRDEQPTLTSLETLTTRGFTLSRLELFAGGLLVPGISYYLTYYPAASNVGLPGQPPLHTHPGSTPGVGQTGAVGFAWVRFADIFGQTGEPEHTDSADDHAHEGATEQKHAHGQDLIVGSHELHLTLSGHHRLTNVPYLIYRYNPTGNRTSFTLDAPQLGASLDGTLPGFGYALSVYNGTSSGADNDHTLDAFLTVTQEFGPHRFGLFGVRGASPTTSTTSASITPIPGTGSNSQPYWRAGADADLNFGPLNLMLFYLRGQDSAGLFDPTTVPGSTAQDAKFHGGFIEGDFLIESVRTMLIGRYDVIRNTAQGLTSLPKERNDTDALTLALRHDVVLTSRVNLQLHLEGNATRTKAASTLIAGTDQTSNTLYAGLDLSF